VLFRSAVARANHGQAAKDGAAIGGGAALTPFGVSLVARYRKIERRAENVVRKELLALRAEIGSETTERN
jgi:molybdenum-dependent DNA-binding transcriptional regulator ModE